MDTMKTEDLRAGLNAKAGSSESQAATLTKEIAYAKAANNQAQVDLQRGSQDRQVCGRPPKPWALPKVRASWVTWVELVKSFECINEKC